MRFILVLAAVAILVGCGPSLDASPEAIKERGELVVGTEATFRPFEYRAPDGEFVGFDMDMARLMAEELEVTLRIENMEFTGLIPSLQSGKIDLILSGMTATEERAKTIAFSKAYFLTGLCLLLNRENAGEIDEWKGLNDPRWTIAVKLGTTSDTFVQQNLPRANRVTFDTENDCAMEVATGRAHAFVYDELSIRMHATANKATTRAILEPFTHEPYSVGMRQNDVELKTFVDDFIDKLRMDGRFAKLVETHGLPTAGGDEKDD